MAKRHNHTLLKRIGIDIAGFGLIILAIATGWLPGPGGLPLFVAGLGVLSLNYEWAEKLLKDLDKKRREYTKRYLEADPLTSTIIDIMSIGLLIGGVSMLYFSHSWTIRGIGIAFTLLGPFNLFANQHRGARLLAKIKQ